MVYLLRHGQTACNAAGRYQGALDEPLSPQGRVALRRAGLSPEVVYVSPLRRARETAELCFPQARQVVVPGLREMDFGRFEGHSWQELTQDPDYCAWVDSGCELPCPGGEAKADFCARTCAAFAALADGALARGLPQLVVVAHGGTQMAVLERFARPQKSFYQWHAPNGGGYLLRLQPEPWRARRVLHLAGELRYAREETTP